MRRREQARPGATTERRARTSRTEESWLGFAHPAGNREHAEQTLRITRVVCDRRLHTTLAPSTACACRAYGGVPHHGCSAESKAAQHARVPSMESSCVSVLRSRRQSLCQLLCTRPHSTTPRRHRCTCRLHIGARRYIRARPQSALMRVMRGGCGNRMVHDGSHRFQTAYRPIRV